MYINIKFYMYEYASNIYEYALMFMNIHYICSNIMNMHHTYMNMN